MLRILSGVGLALVLVTFLLAATRAAASGSLEQRDVQGRKWLTIQRMQDRAAPMGFEVRLRNPEEESQKLTLKWKLCDPFGAPIRDGSSTATLDGNQEQSFLVAVDPQQRVACLWAAVLDAQGKTVDSGLEFVAIEPASLQRIEGSARWGLSGAITFARVTPGTKPYERVADLLAAAGCRFVRGAEMSRTFDWDKHTNTITSAYEKPLQSLRDRGIETLTILGYAPPWASTKPADASEDDRYMAMPKLDVWVDLVKQYIRTYKIKMVEVWNEPNGGFWNSFPKDETYGALLKATYKAIKEVDPSIAVVACSTNNSSPSWPESVLKVAGAGSVDVISFHPYITPAYRPGAIAPELGQDTVPPAAKIIGDMNAMSAKYNNGKPIPLYITEVGVEGIDLETNEPFLQAMPTYTSETLARTLLVFAGLGVERTYWFEYDDVVPSQMGIIRGPDDLSLKPAWWAFRALNERAGTGKIGKLVTLDDDLFSLTMKGKPGVVAVWTAKDPALVTTRLPVTAAYDLFGRKAAPVKVGTLKAYVVPVGSVLYLQGDPNLESKDILPLLRMKAQSQWALPGETIRYTVEASQYAREQIKGSIPASVAFSVDPAAGKWAVGTCVLPIGKTKIAFPVLMPTADKVSAGFTFNEQCRPEVRLSNKEREPILAHIRIAAGEQVQEVHEEIPPAGSDKATLDYRPENPEKGVEVKATVEVDKRQWSFGRKLYFASVHRGKITIDGNTDDWASLPRISLREWYKLTSDKPDGFSADMSLAYDDKAFYALVEVKDRAHFQRFSPSESWRGDSVQIAFDTEPVGEHHPIEMTFGLTDSGEPIFYSPMMNENLDGITGKVVRRSGKTVYEMRFPMSALHGVQAKPGSRLGFSLLVNDNDTGAREGWLCWSGGIGDRKDAELYGQLLLAE